MVKMTLKEYIKKRNGVAVGSQNSLRNNLYRSLGSRNFSAFWTYWNPIFGYYLGKLIFKPLKKIFPIAIALVVTFVFCGMIHDAVTTMVRGTISFFFTFWFFLMGVAVLMTRLFKIDLSEHPWKVRAFNNIVIIGSCFVVTLYCREIWRTMNF